MSAINRVVDYMAGLPQAAEHAQTYATEFTERLLNSSKKDVNGVEVEKGILSKGEKAILGRLNCPAKFTRKGFYANARLAAHVATEDRKVYRQNSYDLDFLGSIDWFLDPVESGAMYSSRESTVHLLDDAQKRRIFAKCPNMSGVENGDVYMTSVHERISTPTDMRHIFMKMYLMLNDYNLAAVSKSEEMRVCDDIIFNLTPNASYLDRLASVVHHDIVIDADDFTPQELGLLSIAGQEYPSVWYCGENMYTKCHMQADDLVLISNSAINVDSSLSWGSPDRLYQMMWTVACKLDCVEHLVSAFESMRGKAKMMADIVCKSDGNVVSCMVPQSFCMRNAFGSTLPTSNLTNAPGFFSSSVSLVTDLLYGSTFEASATCVIESLGGCGLLLNSRTPSTCNVFNGILRDYGFVSSTPEENILLNEWDIMAGRPMTWDIGALLKEYAVQLSTNIINGHDIQMPQILHAIPSLTAVNTSFGLARGWRGPKHLVDTDKLERASDADALAALSWLMGERKVRPAVFYNRVGKKPPPLSQTEFALQAEIKGGGLGFADVEFWVDDTLGGRVDENEESASVLFRTEYAGTKCSIIYDESQGRWVSRSQTDPPGRQSMKGTGPAPDEEEKVVSGIEEIEPGSVRWGSNQKPSAQEMFTHLANLSRSNKIVPSSKPRHTRVSSYGTPVVADYHIDGGDSNSLLRYSEPKLEEGKDINYSVIKVPGDGTCGIHAIVEDLKSHGMIGPSDVAKAHTIFSSETASKTFHDTQELAALVQDWGMKLDVYDTETGAVHRFGRGDGHTVTIIRNGNHFDAGILGQGQNTGHINRIHVQENAPTEFIEAVRSLGAIFAHPSS